MPTALTRVAVRLRDSLDEFIERMEDGEAGRRDKYGRKTQLWHDHEYQRKRRLRRHRSKIEVSERLKRINNDSELNATMHGALNTLEEPEGGSRDGPLGERGFAQRGQQTGSGEHGRIAFREDNGGGESQIFTRDGTHSAFPGRGGSLVYPSSRERRDSSGGGDNSRGGPRRGSRQYLYHNHSSHDTNVEVAHQSRNPKPLPQSQFALEGEFVDPPPITVDQEVKEKRVRFAGLQESRLRQPSVEESIPEEPELDREHHDERHSGEPKTTAPAHLMRPEPYLEETNSEYLSEAGLQDVDHALVDGSQPSPEERRKEVQSPAAGLSQRPPRVEQYQHNISPMPSMGSMTDRVNEVSVKKADANAKSAKRNFDGADTDTESPKLMEPLESQNMNATAISLATDDSISAEQFPALRLRGGGKDERSHSSSGEPHGGKFGNEDKYHDHEDFDDEYTGEEVEAHILHSSGHSESYVFERDRRTYGSVGTGKFSTKASPVERERRAYGGIHGERFSTAAFPKQPKAKGTSSWQENKAQGRNTNILFNRSPSPPRDGFAPRPFRENDWKRSGHPGEVRPENFEPRRQPPHRGEGLPLHEKKFGAFGVGSRVGGLHYIDASGNMIKNTRAKPMNRSQQWGARCPPKPWHGSTYKPLELSSSDESVTYESEEEEEEEEDEVEQRPARGHAERRKAKKEPVTRDPHAEGQEPKHRKKPRNSSTGRKRPKRDVSPPDYAGAVSPPPNHYATLGLKPNASMEEIILAAKRKRIEKHPDRLKPGKSQEECAKIDHEAAQVGMAADVLTKPTEKAEYDEEIRKWKRRYGTWPNEV